MPNPTVYCNEEGTVWFGFKKEWKNKKAFAYEVYDLQGPEILEETKTDYMRGVKTAKLDWCKCEGKECPWEGDHVMVVNDGIGMAGYVLDLEQLT